MPGQRRAPARAVEAERDEVATAHAHALVEAAALRQVADPRRVRSPGGAPSTGAVPLAQREQPEQHLEERRLAGAVGAEDADELARVQVEIDAAPDGLGPCATAAPRSSTTARHRLAVARGERLRRARAARATCHCSKLSPAGDSVSVTVTIGMPAAAASWLTRCTSGVTFWAVEDPDLDQVRAGPGGRPSRLSAAVTSVPSAIAFAKLYGRQQAQAEGLAERLEDALAVADRRRRGSARGSARSARGRGRAPLVSNGVLAARGSRPPSRGIKRACRSADDRGDDARHADAGEYHWCGFVAGCAGRAGRRR